MNSDFVEGLNDFEKQLLFISKEKAKRIINDQIQTYFEPDGQDASVIQFVKQHIECINCKRIPLQLQTCSSCQAINCFKCLESNDHKCHSCKNDWDPQEIDNKMVVKILEGLTQKHDCKIHEQFGGSQELLQSEQISQVDSGSVIQTQEHQQNMQENDPLEVKTAKSVEVTIEGYSGISMDISSVSYYTQYNIFELYKHVITECPRSRHCHNCKLTFDTIKQYEQHLEMDCVHVKVRCSSCNLTLSRQDFKKPDHKCYVENAYQLLEESRQKIGELPLIQTRLKIQKELLQDIEQKLENWSDKTFESFQVPLQYRCLDCFKTQQDLDMCLIRDCEPFNCSMCAQEIQETPYKFQCKLCGKQECADCADKDILDFLSKNVRRLISGQDLYDRKFKEIYLRLKDIN